MQPLLAMIIGLTLFRQACRVEKRINPQIARKKAREEKEAKRKVYLMHTLTTASHFDSESKYGTLGRRRTNQETTVEVSSLTLCLIPP